MKDYTKEITLAYEAIQRVKDMYPTDIFPKDGNSLSCKMAKMARITCDNIKRELDELIERYNRISDISKATGEGGDGML